jgi:hypothetical protein
LNLQKWNFEKMEVPHCERSEIQITEGVDFFQVLQILSDLDLSFKASTCLLVLTYIIATEIVRIEKE